MTRLRPVPQRTATLLGVGRVLAQAVAGQRGVPPAPALTRVQRSAERSAGVPRLVAEILASYTAEPLVHGRSRSASGAVRLTVAGRSAERPDRPGAIAWSASVPDDHLATDLVLARTILGVGMRLSPRRAAFARAVIDGLAADASTASSPAASRQAAEALAAAAGQIGAPAGLEVVGEDAAGRLGLRTTGPPEVAIVDHAAALLDGAGIVHGRLGALALGPGPAWTITHWELARRVSPSCRAFLLGVVQHAGRPVDALDPDGDELMALGEAVGIPGASLHTNLPALLDLLAPVARAWPTQHVGLEPALGGTELTAVPDPLGVLYGLADLLALRGTVPPAA